ncbi:MAG: hypothetical protein HQP61_05070 [Peptococcaceae bacterium]|nr:hypothetical protein [Candidatus Syntrophopropionicum ammoniitolerans]
MGDKLITIRIPGDILTEMDSHVLEGDRNSFIIGLVRQELDRLKRLKKKKITGKKKGVFVDTGYPELKTLEDITNWAKKRRAEFAASKKDSHSEK